MIIVWKCDENTENFRHGEIHSWYRFQTTTTDIYRVFRRRVSNSITYLLTGCFSSSGFACGLLGTSHLDLFWLMRLWLIQLWWEYGIRGRNGRSQKYRSEERAGSAKASKTTMVLTPQLHQHHRSNCSNCIRCAQTVIRMISSKVNYKFIDCAYLVLWCNVNGDESFNVVVDDVGDYAVHWLNKICSCSSKTVFLNERTLKKNLYVNPVLGSTEFQNDQCPLIKATSSWAKS